LKCKAVIHAPTVDSPGGRSTRDYVYKATLAALRVARERGFKSIAFPLMGAGVGGLSPEESIDAMSRAFLEAGEGVELYIYVTKQEVLEAISSHMLRSGWREL
jgi:O-acetyl-ADP-ribose deacetylase (regulator of RNase III)